MMNNLMAGLQMVLQWDVMLTILLASIYGLVVGALQIGRASCRERV